MKTIMIAYGAAIIGAALATPAMSTAPVSGTYAGTTADGNSVSFVVGTDTNTGEQAVKVVNISFSAPCRGNSYVLNTDWSFGLDADIHTSGKVTIDENDNYFRFVIALDFDSETQSATGTVLSTSPTLFPVGLHPTHALICTSPKQTLTVTLQSSDAAQRELAPGTRININSPRANDDSSVEASH